MIFIDIKPAGITNITGQKTSCTAVHLYNTQYWITISVELAILASYMTSVVFTFPQPHHLTTRSTYVWHPHQISNQCDVGP